MALQTHKAADLGALFAKIKSTLEPEPNNADHDVAAFRSQLKKFMPLSRNWSRPKLWS